MQRRSLLFGLLSLGACSLAENLRQDMSFDVVGERMFLSGEITTASRAVFIATLDANPQVRTIVMRDLPGSLDDEAVLDMGYLIRSRGLNTHLEANSGIYSGAVDLFLSGKRRTMARGAEIGVHSWADGFGEGAAYPREAREHRANAQYTKDMLGSDAFYWFTLQAASSDEIYVMNAREIARFGLLTAPIQG